MFFNDPSLLVGVPLLVLGILGVGVVALTMLAPQPSPAGAVAVHRGHPGPMEYVQIGVTLAVITSIEVAIYYVNMPQKLFITTLIVLSAAKFSLVVLFFMHLKFDSRLFSTAFVAGFMLVLAVFTVVLTTLGGNII
ncbi:MAG TPA: cytochrome C oxidase subunit IV family protein [Dehalococcoidia bacterium]|nr:cytochrome C oxidase subunit IV family protein [Dehalococcoidia bacterium]